MLFSLFSKYTYFQNYFNFIILIFKKYIQPLRSEQVYLSYCIISFTYIQLKYYLLLDISIFNFCSAFYPSSPCSSSSRCVYGLQHDDIKTPGKTSKSGREESKTELQGVGGRLLFEALQQNNTLLVLDVSYNGLGCGQKCYEKIVAFITNNKTLLHLDLTLNQFKKDDSKCISDVIF